MVTIKKIKYIYKNMKKEYNTDGYFFYRKFLNGKSLD